MALRVENLSVGRGGLTLLEGVSFDLAPGKALVLRGPNGLGKTTLLRVVAGLQPALSGQVVAKADTIAYAAHADGLKATLTATENLNFWASVYGTKSIYGAEVVAAALAAMDMATLGDRMAMHLSAGQKRRLGLARLLVTGRPVWVLDEPTVSLDAASVQLFAGVVRRHLATGGSTLIATHIDLGLEEASVLDLTPFRSRTPVTGAFDEAFG